jgi:hypothetical protein
MEGFALTNQRGIQKTFAVASAAAVAALASFGAPAPAAAATSTAAMQVADAFPTDSFFLRNPSQQGRCVMPTTPSFVGPLTLQTCGDLDQYFYTFTWEGETELKPLWGSTADGYSKCLVADASNKVHTKSCKDVPDNFWQVVGKTVKHKVTGKCLSANNAGAVYVATCDGAINRNWEFPTSLSTAVSGSVHAAREARRAELAALAR